MRCWKCHAELPEGAPFCYYCGASQNVQPSAGPQQTYGHRPTGTGRPPKKRKPVHLGNSEFDLYEVLEKVAAVAGFAAVMPIALNVFSALFTFIGDSFGFFSIFGHLFYTIASFVEMANTLVHVILIAALLCEVVGLIYYMSEEKQMENQVFFVAIGASAVAMVSLVFSLCGVPLLFILLAIGAFVLGTDIYVKVMVDKVGFNGKIDLGYDFTTMLGYVKSTKNNMQNEGQMASGPDPTLINRYNSGDSWFDGTGVQVIGYYLLCVLLGVVTCGILLPWGYVNIIRWRVSHTVINGRRQYFNGTAVQLFGLWVKWILLILVTCGIYSYFARVDYMKWETKHTTYADDPGVSTQAFNDSVFTGNSFEFLGYSILTGILSGVTCSIAYPWCDTMITKWEKRNTVIRNQRYFYDGTGGGIFFIWLTNTILTVLTCGLYGPWAMVRENKYIVSHTHVENRYY